MSQSTHRPGGLLIAPRCIPHPRYESVEIGARAEVPLARPHKDGDPPGIIGEECIRRHIERLVVVAVQRISVVSAVDRDDRDRPVVFHLDTHDNVSQDPVSVAAG